MRAMWVGAGIAVVVATLGGSPADPAALTAQGKAEKDWVTPAARKAVDAGLDYLGQCQAGDGSWGTGGHEGSLAVTALAAQALLHGGRAPDGARVTRAVEYVLRHDGLLARPGSGEPMYEHAFAVAFLADAHARTADEKLKARTRAALTAAVRVIVDSQNRAGGWRYHPRPADADVSATSCQLYALAAAKAAGVDVPRATIDGGVKYVRACQDLRGGDGGFMYTPALARTGFPRSAAAVAALQAVGFEGDKAVLEKGVEYLRAFRPPAPREVHYYFAHFFAARAMRAAGGKDWADWYPAVRDDLLARREGDHWPDPAVSAHYGTAVALIVLQMPNR